MRSNREKRQERREKLSARKRALAHKDSLISRCFRVPNGVRLFQVKGEGVVKIDIIPYTVPEGAGNPYANDGDLHFERTYFCHRDVGPDSEVYPCLKKTFGEACPICDYRSKLIVDGDNNEELIRNLAPKERQLWNVFDYDNPDFGVQLWDCSFHLFGKVLDARITNSDEEDGYEYFADPEYGMTLRIGFSEKKLGTFSFYVAESIDFKPRRQPISQELLSQALVLDDLLIHYSYEELKRAFLQHDIREPKEDEDDEDDVIEQEDVMEEEEPKKEDASSADKSKRRETMHVKTASRSEDDDDPWDNWE